MAKAVIIKESHTVKQIKEKDYANFTVVPSRKEVRINDYLPFRVKFINIGIEGVSPSLVPPIPLQVIGYSNYIL